MHLFRNTPIRESIIEAYDEKRIVLHASQIPISIMDFCMKNYARVVGILEDGFIIVESVLSEHRSIRYMKKDGTWKDKTFGLHHSLYGKDTNTLPSK